MKDSEMTVNSPCIQVCVASCGVCIGCGRTMDEIASWVYLTNEEKDQVNKSSIQRLEKLYD